jgi:hypothetical protein
MAGGNIDLASLFKQVSKAVQQNQDSLNEADSYNHDHGDHMVEIFDVISQAMKEKKSADPADQLEYAAQLLRKKTNSGSSTLYADGLDNAAKQITGKNMDAGSVVSMLQTMLGASDVKSESTSSGGDVLGSLLGQLSGSSSSSNSDAGLDLGDILNAGMSYMSAKQSGKSDLEALTGAFVSSSQIASGSSSRAQSTEIVTSTVLSALTSMLKK